jgi:hypothetical protein
MAYWVTVGDATVAGEVDILMYSSPVAPDVVVVVDPHALPLASAASQYTKVGSGVVEPTMEVVPVFVMRGIMMGPLVASGPPAVFAGHTYPASSIVLVA